MNTCSAKNPKADRECHKIIRDLQYQIECCKAELDLVLHQLALCRARARRDSYHDQIKLLQRNVPPHAPMLQNDQFEYSRIMQGNFALACCCTCSSYNNQVKSCIIKSDFSSFQYPEQSHKWVNTSSLSNNETVFFTNFDDDDDDNDDDVDAPDVLCCKTPFEFDPQNREVRYV